MTKGKQHKKKTIPELNASHSEHAKQYGQMPVILILDNIRSALNVGSIFRTADVFHVSECILCGITARPPHKKLSKTAIGAEQHVSWKYYSDTAEAIEHLRKANKKLKIFAVEQTLNSISLYEWKDLDIDSPIAIILGNEVEGVQQNIIDACDAVLEIEQYGNKHSLNVSVSAGVVLHRLSLWYRDKI